MIELVKKIFRIKGIAYIILAFAAGIMLIALSGNRSTSDDGEGTQTTAAERVFSFEEYEKTLESRLAKMVDSIDGASGARVMVVIDNSYKYDVAEKNGSYTVIRDESGGQSGLVLAEYAPSVRGVAVVCNGGDDPTVQKKILSMLASVLDLPTSKIFVASGG